MSEASVFGPDEPDFDLPPSILEAQADPDGAAAWTLSVPPSSAVVAALAVLDPARMSPKGQLDAVRALDRVASWVAAMQNRMLSALEADYPKPAPSQWTRHEDAVDLEVSAALRLSARTAGDRIHTAMRLVRDLPATDHALARGELTVSQSRVLVEAVTRIDDPTVLGQIETRVLERGSTQTVSQFKRSVTRAVHALAPTTLERERDLALTDRYVRASAPDPVGMAVLTAVLSAEGVAAVMTALDTAARAVDPSDPRTIDQRRADALVDLALGPAAAAAGGELRHGLKPAVSVVVALSTLLGLDEEAGELNGHPVPAPLARLIASDPTGTWRRLVTDQRGVLLDYGRTRYRPPANLAKFVIARDRTCRFPTCERQAETSDLDHEVEWWRGGYTNASNLNAVSPKHHHSRHDGGWKINTKPDGTTEWTSPLGRTYAKPPSVYPLDQTIPADDPPPF